MLLGRADFIAQAKVWMHRLGGNVYRRSPYVVSAALQFEKRLAEMPAYFQRTVWLFSRAVNTAFPQQCMFEWYVGDHLLRMPDVAVRQALDALATEVMR